MEVKVVIGSNFGDEGKGLMVDYFAHQAVSEGKKVLNILTNGGPQRGHIKTHWQALLPPVFDSSTERKHLYSYRRSLRDQHTPSSRGKPLLAFHHRR